MSKIVDVSLKMKPTQDILKRLNLEKGGKLQKYFRDEVARQSDPYVPMVSGALASYITPEPDEIWYITEYAEYQYRGAREDLTHLIKTANRNRDNHPLATSYWTENMWRKHKDDVIDAVRKEMERLAKE